ncbi:DUF1517 domain-containing protein [Microcoleus sp. FACHB-831]|uniref:DUF1517 domain-containing protein n=1 Tax=Microcoleus sp. FACHB-831 TaxID=2692827 RepID=UPI001685FB42|nr:DUF1517 domain-containing protein [Microcoleus sp. FACHB-831]MBD1924064.1 DUF1517 domain-containing protein [Microcoleus sp. FACHB-831]
MRNKLLSAIKPILKSLFLAGLVLSLALGNADGALAARSGGRIGGGSFRAPSRTYSPPSRTYAPPSGGYYPGGGGYYPGGGIGFPFLFPFFGIGGGFGGLFTILLFLGLANFLVQTFRNIGTSNEEVDSLGYSNSKVSVAKVQVGLLSQARSLQGELNELANSADTGTAEGRAQVLQESTLALLRHPEYWVYGATEAQQTALVAAEAKFNQLALGERSKFSAETLSNVNNQLRQAPATASLPAAGGELAEQLKQLSGEYIVVTIVVGAEGNLQLPKIDNTDDLRQALRQIGGISSERLLAVEILWTPQAEGDTLTTDDMLAEYPDLKLV